MTVPATELVLPAPGRDADRALVLDQDQAPDQDQDLMARDQAPDQAQDLDLDLMVRDRDRDLTAPDLGDRHTTPGVRGTMSRPSTCTPRTRPPR